LTTLVIYSILKALTRRLKVLKKLIKSGVIIVLAVNLCGCVAVMASLAESAKAKQKLDIPYSQALDLVKEAFKTLDIKFISADIRPGIALVKGNVTDDKTARILISKISDSESLIAVRVGTSEAGKADAERILQRIIDYSNLVDKQ